MQRLLKVVVMDKDQVEGSKFAKDLEADGNIETVQAVSVLDGAKLARRERQIVSFVVDADADQIAALRTVIPGSTIIAMNEDVSASDSAARAGAHKVIEKGTEESRGEGLRLAVRKAVLAHDMQVLSSPPLRRNDKILEMVTQMLQKSKSPE